MRIVNVGEVAAVWLKMCSDVALDGIILRHAEKKQDGGAFTGLSGRGILQRDAFYPAIKDALMVLGMRGVRLVSSNTLRTVQTAEPLMVCFHADLVLTANLRFPNLDPDLEAARQIAAQHGINIKQAIRTLEQHGRKRLGEHPDQYRARIKQGIVEQMERAPRGQVLLLSGSSPVFNEAAFDMPGELGELEAAFFSRQEGNNRPPYQLLEQVKPVFED